MTTTRLLRSVSIAIATAMAVSGALAVGIAHASAPMVKTSAPGYFRFMLGQFEVTALSDGTLLLPIADLLTNLSSTKANQALAHSFLANPVETSVNGYLINTGDKLVLIDTGAAGLFGPTLGRLRANLIASGYRSDQVDEIYITHMHPDHIGGLLAAGKAAFPNAIVRVDQRDADHWLSPRNLDQAPEQAERPGVAKQFFSGPINSLQPYVDAGRLKPFDGDTELMPGIKAVVTRGHTPGHSIYLIESKGQKLVLWGDLMHAAAIQFEAPGVTIQFDSDNEVAAGQRKKAYADAAAQGYLVGAAHLSFPGLGHLRAQGSGYTFVPMNYTSLP